MRYFAMVLGLALVTSGLSAASLAELSFGKSFHHARNIRQVNLFTVPPETGDVARSLPRLEDGRVLKTQLIDDSGPDSDERMFAAGVSLGFHSYNIGLGMGAWFDFHLFPWLAFGTRFHLAYGILTRTYEDGGDALHLGVSLGAKFVLDFPDMEVTRWLRPWVALYPAGFAYVDASEDFDPPGADDNGTFKYSDIFYFIQAGTGVDFYLTNFIGLGLGVYITGTVGGSRHEKDGTEVRTRGLVGVYFEYARLSLRF